MTSQVAKNLDYPNFFKNLDFGAPDGTTLSTGSLSATSKTVNMSFILIYKSIYCLREINTHLI